MRRAFSRDEIAAAAAVAVAQGVAVTIEKPDGNRITVTPQGAPKVDPFDLVDVSR